jgi:hypothetical protein
MKYIFLTIALIAIFCFKQSQDAKTYKVEFESHHLEFNKKELADIIAKTWQINN